MEISSLMLWSLKEDNKLKNMLSMCGNVFTKMVPVQFKVMLPPTLPKKVGKKKEKKKKEEVYNATREHRKHWQ